MKPLSSRIAASVMLALLAVVLAGATAPKPGATKHPDKLVILSTTDVKGKTSPCG